MTSLKMLLRACAFAATAAIATSALPARADIAGPLEDALRTTSQASSYHFTVSELGKTFQGDYAKPGNYRMSMMGMDMVVLDGASYMRQGGVWHKYPGMGRASMTDLVKHFASKRRTLDSMDLGMRTVDGQSMHAYKITGKDGHGELAYIDNGGHIGRIETKKIAISFSRFDQPVSIKAPI